MGQRGSGSQLLVSIASSSATISGRAHVTADVYRLQCLNRFFVSDYLRTEKMTERRLRFLIRLNRFFVSDYLRTAPPPNH